MYECDVFYFYSHFLSLALLHNLIHFHMSRWSLWGIRAPSVLIQQVLYSHISDLVGVQHCLSACSPGPPPPSGSLIGSAAFSSSSVNRKGSIFSRDTSPRSWWCVCVCVRTCVPYVEMTGMSTEDKTSPEFGSGPQYTSCPDNQQRTKLKAHIGVCQLVQTHFTLRCLRLSIEHIPARVSGQCRRWRTHSVSQAVVICLTFD